MFDNIIRLVNDNESILLDSLGCDLLRIIKRLDKSKVGINVYLL